MKDKTFLSFIFPFIIVSGMPAPPTELKMETYEHTLGGLITLHADQTYY